jgi:hypothetical protein
MKSRDGKSQRREEKKKETNLPSAFPYSFLQHTETTHTNTGRCILNTHKHILIQTTKTNTMPTM